MDKLYNLSVFGSPTPPLSPPFNWDNAPHADLSLMDPGEEKRNTFDELLQMAIGKPNKNFITAKEADLQRLRESSSKEFSEHKDDGTYYDAEEELPLEAMFWIPQQLHVPGDENVGCAWDGDEFQKIYEPTSTTHAWPSYSGRSSHCVGSDLVGCDNLREYNDGEGVGIGCEGKGGTWKEVREGVHVYGWGGSNSEQDATIQFCLLKLILLFLSFEFENFDIHFASFLLYAV
jgi:hypothetical protein